jgi:hypothetical protein
MNTSMLRGPARGPVPIGPNAFFQLSPRFAGPGTVQAAMQPCQQATITLDVSADVAGTGSYRGALVAAGLIIETDSGEQNGQAVINVANGPNNTLYSIPQNFISGGTVYPVVNWTISQTYSTSGGCSPSCPAGQQWSAIEGRCVTAGGAGTGGGNVPMPVVPHDGGGPVGGTGPTGASSGGMSRNTKIALGVTGGVVVIGLGWWAHAKGWF